MNVLYQLITAVNTERDLGVLRTWQPAYRIGTSQHCVSIGILQPESRSSTKRKCCSMLRYKNSMMWVHYARLEATSLAASYCDSVLTLSWLYSFTRHWMAHLHSTWWITASLSLRLAANDFHHPVHARFQELAQFWAIDLLLLLYCDSGTTYLTVYVILNLPNWNSAGC